MKKILLILAALCTAVALSAQTTVKVQAPNLVGVNEQFNVTFIIAGENEPSDFNWTPGDDFQLVWGPQRGKSTSVSIINGNRTKSSQTTFTYILMPRKTGRFQLPAATAVVKGERITSDPATIEIVSDGADSQGQQGSQGSRGQENSGASSSSTSKVDSGDLFLRLSFSKTSVIVGEPISATLKLYQRVNISGFEDARFPAFNGFWSQEVQAPTNIEFHRENVGDKIYNAAVLRSWNLIPQQAGEIKVDPAELVCLVNIRVDRPSIGSIFDSFFQDDYQTIRKRVTTGPVTIKVSGLPAGAPASFGGGVGNFKMNAELTRDSLSTHDAASLKVTVTGTGNVSLLEAPKISFPPDFEAYDVKTTDVQGGKCFEYPFIPRSHGDFTIGPVEYSYFDIASRKYVTLRSQPLGISVAKGNEPAAATGGGQLVSSGVARKDVRNLGSDIRCISTKAPAFAPVGSFFAGSSLFWILSCLLLLLAAAAYVASRNVSARRADVVGSKNRAATKMARKRLSQAGTFLKGNLYTAFYEELHKALLGFVSDKLNMDAADMSKENIAARLSGSGASEATVSDFIGLLDACEFARYSPDAGHDAMNAHFETAVAVISSLDESMKRKSVRNGGAAAAVLALALLVPANSRAASSEYADSLWTAGVNAYAAEQWAEAAGCWNSIVSLGVEAPELYYNLGNAYFKQDEIARAILNYERALKLDPSYSDARFNLEFAGESVQDKIESVPEFFLEVWGRKACWLLPSNAWAGLFIFFLAVLLVMVLLFLLGRTTATRRTGFIAGIAAFLLAALCLDFAFWQRTDYRNADSAIVMRAVTSVKSSPGSDSAKDLFILHEGTKVKLLDQVGEWHNIELSDGRQGWMKTSDLEVI